MRALFSETIATNAREKGGKAPTNSTDESQKTPDLLAFDVFRPFLTGEVFTECQVSDDYSHVFVVCLGHLEKTGLFFHDAAWWVAMKFAVEFLITRAGNKSLIRAHSWSQPPPWSMQTRGFLNSLKMSTAYQVPN